VIKLWSYWRSSCAYRVRIALGLKGLPFEYAAVDLLPAKSTQHLPEFRARNPLGQVPVLEVDDGGETLLLVQSMAIIEYVDERFPEPPLLPPSARGRAHVRALAELVNSGIQPLQNTSTFVELQKYGVPTDAWTKTFIERGLTALERLAQPQAGAFLFGDSASLADIYLVPQLYNARRWGVPLEAFPTLTRAEASAQALPAFRAAVPEAQPDAPA
jgi:maleylpyruvate isomerase